MMFLQWGEAAFGGSGPQAPSFSSAPLPPFDAALTVSPVAMVTVYS